MSAHSTKFTKKERAHLRQLAGEAWEAELAAELEKLFECFCRWADTGISAFDLSDKIHAFHDGVSRELYLRYTSLDPATAVARAVALGLLPEEGVGDALLEKLGPQIAAFRSALG